MEKVIDGEVVGSEIVAEYSSLGLDQPRHELESYYYRFFGEPAYVKEGRDTFQALVPDRFKKR